MTRKQKFVQKGGMRMAPLPAEVLRTNSGRYHHTGASALNITDSAWGANVPTSRGTIVADNLMGPDLGPTRHSGMQTGGARRKSKSNNRRRSQKNKTELKIITVAAHKKIKTVVILSKKLPILKPDVL